MIDAGEETDADSVGSHSEGRLGQPKRIQYYLVCSFTTSEPSSCYGTYNRSSEVSFSAVRLKIKGLNTLSTGVNGK